MPLTKVCPRCGEEYDGAIAFCAKDGTRLVSRGMQADLISTVVADRYRIVARIGEGGMGQVYLAEHVRMKRKSAIKIMRPSLVGDVEALQRFTREAENASQIAHPNVAAIFDFGETADGIVYLAMEYVDGTSLAAKLGAEHVLHPDVAADILGQAADALQAAHDLGILHRDLKPDNIMLARRNDGTFMVKLVDFGIARTMDGADQKVTRTGFAIGTPAFMSPEQLAGDVLDARSDQYSLALVAFVALTGKDAFPPESSKESLIARLTSRPRTLQEAREDVRWPQELQDVFDRALSPEPAERFATINEFARALAIAISGMTPSQTAELYRRALDIRLAHVAMRTPHSDMQAYRTPNAAQSTITPEASQPAIERDNTDDRRATPRNDAIEDRRGAPRVEPARFDPIPAALVSGAYPKFQDDIARDGSGDARGVAASAEGAPVSPSMEALASTSSNWPPLPDAPITPGVADAAAPTTPVATRSARAPRVIIGAGAAAIALFALWFATRGDSASPSTADTMAATAGAPIVDSALSSSVRVNDRTSTTSSAPATEKRNADSVARIDSAKRVADSTKRRAALLAAFPLDAWNTASSSTIDLRTVSHTKDDIRVTIMSPVTIAWRANRARVFKQANRRPQYQIEYDYIDPIEPWKAWKSTISTRKPAYVIQVGPAAAPIELEPEKMFDVKRGDVSSIVLLRDDVAVTLGNTESIEALKNYQEHLDANRASPKAVFATIPPEAFAPNADGKWPKLEVRATDRMRGGSTVRIEIPQRVVERAFAELKPWRDLESVTISPASARP